jgi:hypothetical protein
MEDVLTQPLYPTGVVPKPEPKKLEEFYLDRRIGTDRELSVPEIQNSEVKSKKHSHYFKDVEHLKLIDVYRVIDLFNVTDPCIQHAVKKLLVAGGRGAGKDINKDVQESIDTLVRWQEMQEENKCLKN